RLKILRLKPQLQRPLKNGWLGKRSLSFQFCGQDSEWSMASLNYCQPQRSVTSECTGMKKPFNRTNTLSRCQITLINGDRKRTRLNSSHVSISYAVFCLKKTKYDTQ